MRNDWRELDAAFQSRFSATPASIGHDFGRDHGVGRPEREKIYREFLKTEHPELFDPKNGLGILKPNPLLLQTSQRNFDALVAENFGDDFALASWPEHQRNDSISAYTQFSAYAQTLYGAAMVAKVLADNKNPNNERFSIGLHASESSPAQGAYDNLWLPSEFPLKPFFLVTKQKVDPLAVIHHEFAHTRFNPENKNRHEFTLEKDEREAVLFYENPVRMLNGYEPRYVYNGQGKAINIITQEVKVGLWTTNENNPRLMERPR